MDDLFVGSCTESVCPYCGDSYHASVVFHHCPPHVPRLHAEILALRATLRDMTSHYLEAHCCGLARRALELPTIAISDGVGGLIPRELKKLTEALEVGRK